MKINNDLNSNLNNLNYDKIARYSLAFVWVFTAFTSAFWAVDIGFNILAQAGITGILADWAVYGGSGLDLFVGIWLLSNKKIVLCCKVQLVVIGVFTVLLTLIAPSFWLHPFGPLTKNLPMMVLILIMLNHSNTKAKNKP